MRLSPLLSAAAATTLLAALATPASAATPPVPGVGTALSGGSIAKLSVAGKALEAIRLSLPTGTVDGAKALVRIDPLLSGGTPVGAPIEVSAGQEKSIPARSEGVPGVLSLTSPGGSVSALLGPNGPVAKATTTGLGDLELLGADVLGNGSFSTTSGVGTVGSTATKDLALDGLALPSLLDLLTKLGLDLEALPAGALPDLLGGLDLLDPAIIGQLDGLIGLLGLGTVGNLVDLGTLSPAALEGLTDELNADQTDALLGLVDDPASTDAVGDLQAQITAVTGMLSGAPASSSSETNSANALPVLDGVVDAIGGTGGTPDLGTGVLDPVLSLIGDGTETGLEDLLADPNLDPAVLLETLQGVLDEVLGGLLGGLLGDLPVDTDDLLGLLDTSLLSIGALDVNTVARSGDTDVADVTGLVAGLNVLGTDVLETALGKSELDLTSLLADKSAGLLEVQGIVDGLLGTVTSVLGGVGVVLPLPEVDLLKVVEESLTVSGGTKTSRAGVEALSLTWALDKLSIPGGVSLTDLPIVGANALPNLPLSRTVTRGAPLKAAALPTGDLLGGVLGGAQLTSLLSAPLSLVLGDLTDTAVFTAAGAVPPTVVVPAAAPPAAAAPGATLPRTGPTQLLALAGVALMGAAVVLRRRRSSLGSLAG